MVLINKKAPSGKNPQKGNIFVLKVSANRDVCLEWQTACLQFNVWLPGVKKAIESRRRFVNAG